MPELSKALVHGVETWCACLAVAGRTYRRTLGAVADMSEAQAHEALEELRKAATPTVAIQDVTFGELALDWQKNVVAEKVAKNRRDWTASLLRRYILPTWGHRLVRSIVSPELLIYYSDIKKRTPRGIASTCRQTMSQIFRYGVASARAERDPAGDLRRYVSRPPAVSRPTILDPEKIGQLMRDIDQVPVLETRLRILLQAYTFTRSGECRLATWSEIDLDAALWTIPAEHVKRDRELLVPLPRQVVKILRELREYLDSCLYAGKDMSKKRVFPAQRPTSGRTGDVAITEGAMLMNLRRIHQRNPKIPRVTNHGFRHTASTLLHKHGENTLWIEEQMSHLDPNKVRSTYNSWAYVDERRGMLQRYADFLDSLRDGRSIPEMPNL